MHKIPEFLLDIIFPPRCIFCEDFLSPGERPLICGRCRETVAEEDIECSMCGGRIVRYKGNIICPTCKIGGRYFEFAYAPLLYKGSVRNAILAFKVGGHTENADPLTNLLVSGLKEIGISKDEADILVSVPPDTGRERDKGFDGVRILAEHISKGLGIEYDGSILKKVRKNAKQSSLGYKERMLNVKGAFAVSGDVRRKRVLLVDDIFTTGATTMEISKILKKAGAKAVFVATVAKAPE